MNSKKSALRGSLYMIAAAVLWSTGGVFIKLIPWAPQSINCARCFVALAAALAVSVRRPMERPTATTCFAGVCFSLTTLCLTMATKMTLAANAILLQYTSPLFIIVIESVLNRRRPKKADVLCSLCILTGIFLCCSGGAGKLSGNLMGLLSGLFFSMMFLTNSRPDAQPAMANNIGFAIGFAMGLPWLAAETDWSGRVLLLVLGLGLGQFCLAYAFFARGIRLVSPLTANFLATLEPILNPVWVALIYAEQIPLRTVLGGGLTLFSALAYSTLPVFRQLVRKHLHN